MLINHYLEEIADVDDERVGVGLDGEPLAVLLQLETGDSVRAQNGDEVTVRVRHEAEDLARHRAWRIPVQAKVTRATRAVVFDVCAVAAYSFCKRVEQLVR